MHHTNIYILLLLTLFTTSAYGVDDENSLVKAANYVDKVFSASNVLFVNTEIEAKLTNIVHQLPGGASYKIRVINDPVVNAYSPGPRFIYVTTGLLDMMDSSDELAFVLGHELAHGELGHLDKSLRTETRAVFWGSVMGAFIGAAAGTYAAKSGYSSNQVADGVSRKFTPFFVTSVVSGYGKSMELEADAYSIRYLKNSVYDDKAAETFAQKMMGIKDRFGLKDNPSIALHLIGAEPGLEERLRFIRDERAALAKSQ